MRFLAALPLILAMLVPARGGDRRPLAVVSVAGRESLAADLDALGAAIDAEGLAATVGGKLSRIAGIASLHGCDGSRRWGAALLVEGPLIAPMAMFPVTDLDALLASAAPILGDVERQSGGLVKIGRGEWTAYVAVRGGWAYVAQTVDDLAELPDADALLAPPRPHADLAIALYPSRLPEAYRTMAIDSLRAELRRRAAAGQPPELDDATLRVVEQTLTDVEHVEWTFSVDGERRRATIESHLLAVPESPLAETIAALGESSGLGIGNNEAGIAAVAVRWPRAASDTWERALAALFPAGAQQDRTLAAIGDALREAFAGADAAWDVVLEVCAGESPTWTAVAQLPDERRGALLEERLTRILADAPVGKLAPRVGRRGDRVAISVGPVAEARLAAALDAPDRARGGVDGWLRLQPLLAAVRRDGGGSNPALTSLSALLEGFDDRMTLSVRGEGRRLESRLELPEGVVRLAAAGLYLTALGVPLGSP